MNRKYHVRFQLHHFFPIAGSKFASLLPSFLRDDEKQFFLELSCAGFASPWWIEGANPALNYIEWLKIKFPDKVPETVL